MRPCSIEVCACGKKRTISPHRIVDVPFQKAVRYLSRFGFAVSRSPENLYLVHAVRVGESRVANQIIGFFDESTSYFGVRATETFRLFLSDRFDYAIAESAINWLHRKFGGKYSLVLFDETIGSSEVSWFGHLPVTIIFSNKLFPTKTLNYCLKFYEVDFGFLDSEAAVVFIDRPLVPIINPSSQSVRVSVVHKRFFYPTIYLSCGRAGDPSSALFCCDAEGYNLRPILDGEEAPCSVDFNLFYSALWRGERSAVFAFFVKFQLRKGLGRLRLFLLRVLS